MTVVNALDRQAGGPDDNSAQAGHLIPATAFHMTQDPISGPVSPALGKKSTGMGAYVPDASGSCAGITVNEATSEQAKTNAIEALRRVRSCVDSQTFQEWALGVLDGLCAAQVLRPSVHGGELRLAASQGRSILGDSPPSRPEGVPAWAVRAVRVVGERGCTPPERRLAGQHANQFAEALSVVPHADTPSTLLRALWSASQGLGLLREALSAVQEVGRPVVVQAEPAHPVAAGSPLVRRLVPEECEALMSWPRGWTAPQGVVAPDSRRYAACGDGVVANVAEWIGRRVLAVDDELRRVA